MDRLGPPGQPDHLVAERVVEPGGGHGDQAPSGPAGPHPPLQVHVVDEQVLPHGADLPQGPHPDQAARGEEEGGVEARAAQLLLGGPFRAPAPVDVDELVGALTVLRGQRSRRGDALVLLDRLDEERGHVLGGEGILVRQEDEVGGGGHRAGHPDVLRLGDAEIGGHRHELGPGGHQATVVAAPTAVRTA